MIIPTTWITVVILELIHAYKPDFRERLYLLDKNQPSSEVCLVIHNNLMDRMVFTSDKSYMFPPYQLWMVGYWPTMAFTGDGGLGLDPGEGA